MRADEGALVALYALLGIPRRDGNGDAALLISGGTELEGTVGVIDESGNRQAVAVHLVDRVQNGADHLDGLLAAGLGNGLGLVDGIGPGGGHVNLDIGGGTGVDGRIVHVDNILALLQVGVQSGILHVLDGLGLGHDLCQGEEGGLENGVGALAHADLLGQVNGVDHIELDVVLGDVALGGGIQMMLELGKIPLAVDEEHAAGLDVTDNREALGDVGRNMAGNEVGLVDVVRALDGLVAEAQVADGDAAGLLRVVLEVGLDILVGMVADDLDGVLVGTDGSVAAQTPELALDGAFGGRVGSKALIQREVGHIVDDAEGEHALHVVLLQLVEHGEDRGRRRILRAEAVAAADDLLIGDAGIGKGRDDVEIERLALRAGLLGAVENGDLLRGLGDGGKQLVRTERTVQADLDKTDLLTLCGEVVNDLFGDIADGAHGDDHAVGIGSAVVVEELVIGAELGIDLAHVLFNDAGDGLIILVGGLAVLEEDVTILVRAAHNGVLGVQGALTEGLDGIHVDHVGQVLVVPDLDLLQLMAGAEAVEEVQEGNSALDGGQVGNRGQVHDLLYAAFGQHRKAGLAAGHDVRVVTEDVQGVAGKGTGADVEDTGKQLAGDLVHIRDHQQQALGGRIGGGQGTGVQRAVHGTGRTGLRLHLLHLDSASENVLPAGSGPLVHIVGHRAGRGDGVDCRNFSKCVGYMGGSIVAVHRFEVSLHVCCSTPILIDFFSGR